MLAFQKKLIIWILRDQSPVVKTEANEDVPRDRPATTAFSCQRSAFGVTGEVILHSRSAFGRDS